MAEGSDFREGIAASIGGVPCASLVHPSDTMLLCTAPALDPGPPRAGFNVTNADGTTAFLAAVYMPQGRARVGEGEGEREGKGGETGWGRGGEGGKERGGRESRASAPMS